MAEPLVPYEERRDLTDRECVAILGGTIGGLAVKMAPRESLRNAIRWWADHFDEAYPLMAAMAGELPPVG